MERIRESAPTMAEVGENQSQWDPAIADFYLNLEMDKNSKLEETIEEAKTSAPEEETPTLVSVEESKKQEKLAEREIFKSALENKRKELAELYAKNRRLIPGHKNKINFVKARGEYENLLDTYLRLETKSVYDNRMEELGRDLQAKLDELNAEDGDIEAKKQALNEAYFEDCKEVKNAVNQNFLENFLEQQNELSAETIKQIDEGNVFRKIVHTFRSNKYIKGALIAAGAAGLAATGIGLAGGLAAGAISIGFDLSAAGAVVGAVRGATTGFISSRQDSKNSAIHSFKNSNIEDIKQRIDALGDLTEQDTNTRGIASWMMEEYDKASTADRKDNRKRTLIATGLGAALGALSSGVEISHATSTTETFQTGQTPDTIKITNFDNVNIAEGHGAYDTFTQMGGNPDKLQQALDIMHSIDSKYGLVPGDSGVAGNFAHTYPGPISSWPDAAQVYIEEVAKEWAKQGLIPSETIAGGPVYTTVTQAVQNYIPTGFIHYLIGAAAGTVVGDINTNKPTPAEHPTTTEQSGHIELSNAPSDSTATEIEKQIAEREAAAAAAHIETMIAEREAIEQKRKAKLAEEELAAEKRKAKLVEEAAIAIEAKIAEKEAAEIEAKLSEKETAVKTETKLAEEAEAAAIEAKIAEREAAAAIEVKLAERL